MKNRLYINYGNEEQFKNYQSNQNSGISITLPVSIKFNYVILLLNIDETKLNVSAESWLAMDYLEMKYLRGWKVKTITDKTLLALRLGIFKSFQKLS